MGARTAAEAMTLHHTSETLALGGADQVHTFSDRKHPSTHKVSHRRGVAAHHPHLAQDRKGSKALALRAAPLRTRSAAPSSGRLAPSSLIGLGLSRCGVSGLS